MNGQTYCTPEDGESQGAPPIIEGVNLWSLQQRAGEEHASGKRATVFAAFIKQIESQCPLSVMMYQDDELLSTIITLLYMAYVLGKEDAQGGANG